MSEPINLDSVRERAIAGFSGAWQTFIAGDGMPASRTKTDVEIVEEVLAAAAVPALIARIRALEADNAELVEERDEALAEVDRLRQFMANRTLDGEHTELEVFARMEAP